jgi:hypothetical protein
MEDGAAAAEPPPPLPPPAAEEERAADAPQPEAPAESAAEPAAAVAAAPAPAPPPPAPPPPPLPRGGVPGPLLVAGVAAMMAAGVKLLLRRKPKRPADFGCIMATLDVAPAPSPSPPAAPLPLAGLRFGIKDMCAPAARRGGAAGTFLPAPCPALSRLLQQHIGADAHAAPPPLAAQLRRARHGDGLRQSGLAAHARARRGARARCGRTAGCGRSRRVQNAHGRARLQVRRVARVLCACALCACVGAPRGAACGSAGGAA